MLGRTNLLNGACRMFASTAPSSKTLLGTFEKDHMSNVPDRIRDEWMDRNLLHVEDHPLQRIRSNIESYFSDRWRGSEYLMESSLGPIVNTKQNFDSLLVPHDHITRSNSETYYVNSDHVLRTHTTCHQADLLKQGHHKWLCSGDVYRRDTVDRTHFPVFHQMDAARVFDIGTSEATVERDLKDSLEGLAGHLFGTQETRWIDEYFPFTEPSFELEVKFQGEWLEVLGCGLIRKEILNHCGLEKHPGWAFGVGLERLAMVLYSIDDIRLFWSRDERFLKQFDGVKEPIKFKPFSKYPPSSRDISFWLPEDGSFHEHMFYELLREICGDLVEHAEVFDSFTHPKTGRESRGFRIDYRSMERSLTNAEVNELHDKLREKVESELKGTLR